MSNPSLPATTNPSLLVRLRTADVEAWDSLVDLYGPLIHGWCRRAGLAEADLDDVGQDVFRAILAGLPKFRKERPEDTFRGWLRTITRSKLADHFRKRGRQPQARGGSDPFGGQEPVAAAEAALPDNDEPSDLQQLVRRGLDQVRSRFSDESIRAFWGTAVEQRPAAEVGRELGLSANAVHISKCRVRKALQLVLGELDPERNGG
jgi:RNA polymerase sigma-70 factor, ECF subfamily